MMNMANMHNKLVKKGWFRTTIRLAAPVFVNGATSSVPKVDRVLKIDLGGNNGGNDKATPTKRSFQPNKSRGILSNTNIKDQLLNVGWFEKTDEAVVHGPRSNGNVDIVPEGASNLDLWLKNNNEGKLSNTSETKSSVGDDVVEILDWIRRKEDTVLPGKRKQGTGTKAELQENLLVKGWYKVSTNFPPKSDGDTSAVFNSGCSQDEHIADLKGISFDKREHVTRLEGKPEEKHENISEKEIEQVDHSHNIADSERKCADDNDIIADIADLKRKCAHDNDSNSDEEAKSTDDIDLDRTTEGSSANTKEYDADLDTKPTDKYDNIEDFEQKTYYNDELRNRRTVPKLQPSKCNHYKTEVEKWIENHDKIVLDSKRKENRLRRNKSEIEHADKRFKKSKPHEKAINNLLTEGWTMVNRSRYQVTLVKLPEREPPKAGINDTLSKSSGIKIQLQAKTVQSENGDVETNVTDLSNNRTGIHRFLQRSRKMLRRIFACGRNEE